jgi:hypothetical protein
MNTAVCYTNMRVCRPLSDKPNSDTEQRLLRLRGLMSIVTLSTLSHEEANTEYSGLVHACNTERFQEWFTVSCINHTYITVFGRLLLLRTLLALSWTPANTVTLSVQIWH